MKLRIAILLLAVVCLSFSSSNAIRAQTVQQWRDSLVVLNRQIERMPQSTDLRLRKAAINIELEQWDYAIEEYGRVLQIDANNRSALYFRAYALNHQRQYDRAKADYERFLSLTPIHFEARFGLALVKRNMGRRQEAMDELNKLVEQFPDSALAYAARADYETELKQYEPALYDWDQALLRDPQNTLFQAARTQLLDAMNGKRSRSARVK